MNMSIGSENWRVLAEERQISRAIRLSAYPLAVILAARIWHRPVSVFDGASLTLLMAVVALALLRRFVYGSIEKPSDRSIGTDFAALVVLLHVLSTPGAGEG